MGVYLSKPVKEKISSNHENKFLKCGASSMQGWRVSQEDAHNCCLDFDSEVSLFAVYDGHGGAEVAEYASKKLPNKIKETEDYKKGDFENALKNAFIEFDATLVTDPVLEELKTIAGSKSKSNDQNSETEEETEEDDVQGLREEARMPLADVIAKYANGTFPKTPALRRIRGESSKSPYLRARPSSSGSSADSEVTSSSSSNSNQEVVTNGVADESTAETNGESSKDNEASVPGKSTDECNEVSSSSVNGESAESVSSSERLSAKRAVAKMFRSLLTTTTDGDESDSDDNDESFNAAADTSTHQSSDEDDTENGDEELGEDDTDDDDEEEDEEEEEEAEEEQEEDDLGETSLKETEEVPGNDSGCTAVVSLVTRERVIVANAGDSRAVLSRKGEAVDLSVDHKPEDPIELKRITGAGGKVTADGRVNGGLNLSRALGDHMYKKRSDLSPAEQMITALPDVKAVDLREGEDEFIVLACDGIWNSMSSQEVVDFVRPLLAKGETLSSICEKLFENCLAEDTLGDGTGCDNMTCVIVQLFPSDKVSSKRKCEETDSLSEDTKRTKVDNECENA